MAKSKNSLEAIPLDQLEPLMDEANSLPYSVHRRSSDGNWSRARPLAGSGRSKLRVYAAGLAIAVLCYLGYMRMTGSASYRPYDLDTPPNQRVPGLPSARVDYSKANPKDVPADYPVVLPEAKPARQIPSDTEPFAHLGPQWKGHAALRAERWGLSEDELMAGMAPRESFDPEADEPGETAAPSSKPTQESASAEKGEQGKGGAGATASNEDTKRPAEGGNAPKEQKQANAAGDAQAHAQPQEKESTVGEAQNGENTPLHRRIKKALFSLPALLSPRDTQPKQDQQRVRPPKVIVTDSVPLRAPPARWLARAWEITVQDFLDPGRTGKAALSAAEIAQGRFDEGNRGRGSARDAVTGRPLKIGRGNLSLEGDSHFPWTTPLVLASEYMSAPERARAQMADTPPVQPPGLAAAYAADTELVARDARRRAWVKKAFLHAWDGYKRHAWGSDELRPVSRSYVNNYNGWGATLVDSLDLLLMQNLSHEYNLARRHVARIDFGYLPLQAVTPLDTRPPEASFFDADGALAAARAGVRTQISSRRGRATMSTFETIIRYLGGLISAYELSGDPLMLARAQDLGEWLLPALSTAHVWPVSRYEPGLNPDGRDEGQACLAEVGTLILEFTKLSMLTGDDAYYRAAQKSIDVLDRGFAPAEVFGDAALAERRLGTLLPLYLWPQSPQRVTGGAVTFGGQADSYYEYLVKQCQLVSQSMPQYCRMYRDAIESAYTYLISNVHVLPGHDNFTVVGSVHFGKYVSEISHLGCFSGAMMGLGAQVLGRPFDLETARRITEACAWAYDESATGIGPEMLRLYAEDSPLRFRTVEASNGTKFRTPRGNPPGIETGQWNALGRPETLESVFYMYRITGDAFYKDRAWRMFVDWVSSTLTDAGFASLADVNETPPVQIDSMESFVLAETLKYYWLIFSPPDAFPLDDWVFNTEAHPFQVLKKTGQNASEFQKMWSGPDSADSAEFMSSLGAGTVPQLWMQVQDAGAIVAREMAILDARPPKEDLVPH